MPAGQDGAPVSQLVAKFYRARALERCPDPRGTCLCAGAGCRGIAGGRAAGHCRRDAARACGFPLRAVRMPGRSCAGSGPAGRSAAAGPDAGAPACNRRAARLSATAAPWRRGGTVRRRASSSWRAAWCRSRWTRSTRRSRRSWSPPLARVTQSVGPVATLRLHGDCHPGNILWRATGPLFVDFDDSLAGPAVQDLWMFIAGSPDRMRREWSDLLEGYEQFAHFDAGAGRGSSRRCGAPACSTTPPGWPSAGQTRPFRGLFRGSVNRVTGSGILMSCVNSSLRWKIPRYCGSEGARGLRERAHRMKYLLVATMALALAACGSKTGDDDAASAGGRRRLPRGRRRRRRRSPRCWIRRARPWRSCGS